jgi:ankyrin repeat protein
LGRRGNFGENRLIAASWRDDLPLLEEALNAGANPNAKEGEPLRQAAQCGKTAAVRRLLERGANPNLGQPRPLAVALINRHAEVVEALLDGGATAQGLQTNDIQSLHVARAAALISGAFLYERLLASGLDPRIDDPDNILLPAVWSGDAKVIQILLELGAKVSPDSHLLLGQAKTSEIALLLLQNGANTSAGQDAALCQAVRDRDLKRARLFLDHGANPNAYSGEALRTAKSQGNVEMTALLLERGAQSEVADLIDRLLLSHAAAGGDIGAMRAAMAKGISHSAKGLHGWPPLLRAAIEGQYQAVEYLASCGADVHASEEAPLRHAVKNGHLETVRVLLARGASARVLNSKPLRDAAKRGDLEMVRALLDAGADPNAKDGEPLRIAAWGGHLSVLKLLLERGAIPMAAFASLKTQHTLMTSEVFETLERAWRERELEGKRK